MRIHQNQRGLGMALIAVILAVVLGAGGAGYYVWSRNKDKQDSSSSTASNVSNKALEEECKKAIDDKDFCKFASNVSLEGEFKSTITTVTPEGTSVMQLESDGTNSRAITTANGAEVAAYISIGNTTYTKDLSDGAWFKFTSDVPETSPTEETVSEELDFEFSETAEGNKTQYKKIGKEACGSLTCFKYQLIDPATPSDEQFVWFDDKDYVLRRFSFKNAEGSNDIIYDYSKVTITEPSPVKEMPGLDASTQAELEATMQQYMQ